MERLLNLRKDSLNQNHYRDQKQSDFVTKAKPPLYGSIKRVYKPIRLILNNQLKINY